MTLGSLYLRAQGCVPCCWRICLVSLALKLVGPCVVLGFSEGMEAFDELPSINVPWSQPLPGVKAMGPLGAPSSGTSLEGCGAGLGQQLQPREGCVERVIKALFSVWFMAKDVSLTGTASRKRL